MLNLRKTIQKINEKDSHAIVFQLVQSEADKCKDLYLLLRDREKNESEIADELKLSPPAYYTLKSRLRKKIQNYLSTDLPDMNIELFRNIASIPKLLNDTPREIAIAHLLKLEKDLIEHDMPNELITVYSALKKMTKYSQKYFEYEQLYNKHMAYTMAIEKAQDLLSDFNRTLGDFMMSREKASHDLLVILQKEIHNYASLYNSHRLTVIKNTSNIQYLLFVSELNAIQQLEVERMILDTQAVLTQFDNDPNYNCHTLLFDFLKFEFLSRINNMKEAEEIFPRVNEKLNSLLLNNTSCFPSVFLLSKAELYFSTKRKRALYDECKELAAQYTPTLEDVPNYINYVKFRAIVSFYAKKYNEAISFLNQLMSDVSFRTFPHAEVELKLFVALCYLHANKAELADGIIFSVQRKIRDMDPVLYKNARIFAKVLLTVMAPPTKKDDQKVAKMLKDFNSENRNENKILGFVKLTGAQIKSLRPAHIKSSVA